MGYDDSHPKRHDGDGTWGAFLKAMQTGLAERASGGGFSASHSSPPRQRQNSLGIECHGSLKYGPNPTVHGLGKAHDPHCTWGAFFQACSAGIREDATTIKRRLSNLPLSSTGATTPHSSAASPLPTSNMVSRGSNFSNTSLFDPDDWDQMAVDECGDPCSLPPSWS